MPSQTYTAGWAALDELSSKNASELLRDDREGGLTTSKTAFPVVSDIRKRIGCTPDGPLSTSDARRVTPSPNSVKNVPAPVPPSSENLGNELNRRKMGKTYRIR